MTDAQGVGGDYVVQVINVYATHWRHEGNNVPAAEPPFELGRLTEYWSLFGNQLPRLLDRKRLPPEELAFLQHGGDPIRIAEITSAESWLFALPSDQVVAALVLYFRSPDLNEDSSLAVDVLERCAYAQVQVEGRPLADHIGRLAGRSGARAIDETGTLPPEHHQIVFAGTFHGKEQEPPREEVVDRILYRIDPPYREEFMPPHARPSGLNQEQNTYGAVTPYVSFLYGHQDYVDNSVFLTTVQAVGTAARFREIWHTAYGHVKTFRATKLAPEVGQQTRADLEELVDQLGNLELDLSFSVETSADLGLLIPSLRIESFHHELYSVMELPTRARTVSRMFARLDSSIRSELTAIDIRERKAEEQKRAELEQARLRRAVAVSALSTVGVPLGFLVSFFGINATQVQGTYSIFDLGHYLDVYLAAAILACVPFAVLVFLNGKASLRAWWAHRRRTPVPPRPSPLSLRS